MMAHILDTVYDGLNGVPMEVGTKFASKKQQRKAQQRYFAEPLCCGVFVCAQELCATHDKKVHRELHS